jgi:repressor LexA
MGKKAISSAFAQLLRIKRRRMPRKRRPPQSVKPFSLSSDREQNTADRTSHRQNSITKMMNLDDSGWSSLSQRQQRMYNFIQSFIRAKGWPPTLREIGQHIDISSSSIVSYNLRILVKKGWLQRDPVVARGIRIMGTKDFAFKNQGVVQVPVLGCITASKPIPLSTDDNPHTDEMITLMCESIPDPLETFALKANDDSLTDALIGAGDIVVLRRTQEAENGELCVVWRRDTNQIVLKHVYSETGGMVALQSVNSLEKVIYSPKDDAQVQGQVVLILRNYQSVANPHAG